MLVPDCVPGQVPGRVLRARRVTGGRPPGSPGSVNRANPSLPTSPGQDATRVAPAPSTGPDAPRGAAVHLLVLTDRPGGGRALLPSLEYLDHTVQDVGLEAGLMQALGSCELVLVDATSDLRRAAAACRSLSLNELGRPVCVVMSEGGLAALKLSWGFDDWLLPSASPVELETRLRLMLDRAIVEHGQRSASVGDLVVDEDSYQVRLRGRPLDLTFREFELIKALASAPNRVFTRDLLLQEVWGYDYFGGSRTVDVHVRRLRAKLGPEYESMIATVRGVGYKLVPPGQRGGDD